MSGHAGRPLLVLFGAGNIGRSFIGQLFARAGYEVVFVDVDARVVAALNKRRGYEVTVKHPDGTEDTLPVRGVRAVDGRDREAVVRELIAADIAATAVGAGALDIVGAVLAEGMRARSEAGVAAPLDVILAENARDAAGLVAEAMGPGDGVGLVRTSIGKMVPIVPGHVADADPLAVFAEPYNTLIVDGEGFRGPVPEIPGLKAVENIQAWVDRKLFLHNLGHAAVAYYASAHYPELTGIADAVEQDDVRAAATAAMHASADALTARYPESYSRTELQTEADDLVQRFANRALGDTVFRVGRDLRRKLGHDERVVGAMLLAANEGLPLEPLARVYPWALGFRATDEHGKPYGDDVEVAALARENGAAAVLREVSGIDPDAPATDAEASAAEAVMNAHMYSGSSED